MQTFLRANLLTAQLASGGPEAGQPVGSAGEAITHFRDDVEDVDDVHRRPHRRQRRHWCSPCSPRFVLGSIDPSAAAILLVPLAGVAIGTRTLDNRIKRYRATDRAAAAAVSGFLGDVMAAATTVKVNGAHRPPRCADLQTLVDARRHTAVRDRVLDDGVQAFAQGAADVGLGFVLLVTAGAMASGAFDVGKLAVFTAYLGWLSFLPRMVGRVLARRKQAGVAFERMRGLVADGDVRNIVTTAHAARRPRARRVAARSRPSAADESTRSSSTCTTSRPSTTRAAGCATCRSPCDGQLHGDHRPHRVGQEHPAARHARARRTADVERRGALERQRIADRAAFLVPPNAAYPAAGAAADQRLGGRQHRARRGAGRVAAARRSSWLPCAPTSTRCPTAPHTLIGPRGLRLSGGQRQRVATARARRCTRPSWWCSTTCPARSTWRPNCSCGPTSPPPG